MKCHHCGTDISREKSWWDEELDRATCECCLEKPEVQADTENELRLWVRRHRLELLELYGKMGEFELKEAARLLSEKGAKG